MKLKISFTIIATNNNKNNGNKRVKFKMFHRQYVFFVNFLWCNLFQINARENENRNNDIIKIKANPNKKISINDFNCVKKGNNSSGLAVDNNVCNCSGV